MKRWVGLSLAASIIFIIDRCTKFAALSILSDGSSIKVIPGFFHFSLVLNNGAAFGTLKGFNAFFIALSIIAILFIVLYIYRNKTPAAGLVMSLGLIMGGAMGNLADRVRFGYVIDFLDFRVWPVFNIADSAITIGTVILAWQILIKREDKSA